MQELVDAGLEIQSYFTNKQWKYCFIGGLALLHWGEPRFTQDIDLTLYTGFENEEPIISDILSHFEARFDRMAEFAFKNRVVLIQTNQGIPADIALGGLPFEEKMIERSESVELLPEKYLRLCSAEDLIIQKAFASRPKDWIDIHGILVRQNKLDWDHIFTHLKYLIELKDAPKILEKLEKMREALE